MNRPWRWSALIVAVAALVVAPAGAASAHNVLRSTSPADGSTLAVAPGSVLLTFDQPALALGTELIVTAPDGRNVADGPPTLVDTTVRQDLAGPLPAGRYTVVWRVTSADGHPISGSFTFSTTQATTGPAPTTSGTALPPTTTAPPASVNSGTGSPPITGGLLGALIGIGIALVAAGGVLILWLTRRRHERST